MIPCNQKKLTTLSFVGGSTKCLGFRIFGKNGTPIDVSQCTARFSIGHSVVASTSCIISKDMTADSSNIFTVTLNPEDTVNLFGKYIYQVTIIDANGTVEEPQQGELYIINNIDKDFLN